MLILDEFEMSAANLREDPTSFIVREGKGLKSRNSITTAELTKVLEAKSE